MVLHTYVPLPIMLSLRTSCAHWASHALFLSDQVRKAFRADTAAGKTLVVADYSQLDLRILAHVTACQSMIAAFVQGGDFHSRMAYGMYDYIQEAVRNGGYDG